MSKKVKLVVITVCCLAVIGFCVDLAHYAFERYMQETNDTIAKLEQEVVSANEKADQAVTKAEDTKKKLKEADAQIADLQKENKELEETATEIGSKPEITETSTAIPEPTIVATETPQPTITYYPGFPTEAVYTSGNGFLEIVGPDANGICTCRIWFNGNKGNDNYNFSGFLDIETATISFSDCTHIWESNGVDGTVNTEYTGGSGALVYVGNDTWRFDDYTGSPDGGAEFSYMMPYGHV